MNRRLACALALLPALLFAACGRNAKPTAPAAGDAPVLVARAPTPRAIGVPYDAEIWAQFDRPLDRSTVDSTTAFLKQDTRRVSCDIVYEPITRRILLRPRDALELQKTYTVILSPKIRAQDGGVLGTQILWQFSTNSLRRIFYSQPPEGSLQGPCAALYWYGNGLVSSLIDYEVYVSADSVAVASRSVPYLVRQGFLSLLPRSRWPSGARMFWAITAVNTQSGERLDGPTASFRVYAADAPVDSMVIPLLGYGGTISPNRIQYCGSTSFPIGPGNNSCIRWTLNGNLPALRLADARVQLAAASGPVTGIQLFYAQNEWSVCQMLTPGPPYPEVNGLLVTSRALDATNMTFQSDGLTSFVEAAGRFGSWYGFLIRSQQATNIAANLANFAAPKMVVTYYR